MVQVLVWYKTLHTGHVYVLMCMRIMYMCHIGFEYCRPGGFAGGH